VIFYRIRRIERRADNFVLGISSCMVPFHFGVSLRDSKEKKLIYSFLISLCSFCPLKYFWNIPESAIIPIEKAMYFPKKLHINCGTSITKLRLLQINFCAVPKGLCETVLCNYPFQFNILYNVATIGRYHARQNLRSQPSEHWYTSAIKITHYKVAWLYFPCYFFANFFFILNHDAARFSRLIATLYSNRPV